MNDYQSLVEALLHTQCDKDHKCLYDKQDSLCKPTLDTIEGDTVLYCYEKCLDSQTCTFRCKIGSRTVCTCPVKKYLTKNPDVEKLSRIIT